MAKCGEKTEVYSRVCGYFRPVSNWNKGKKEEFKDRKTFEIYKFRTMVVDAERLCGARLASEHDPRITKVGKFLRACRMDELPQLINILKGEMSIVGPRPERPELA